MAKIDSCDKVVGSGSTVIAVGSYKATEGEKEVTRYKFGIRLDIPSQTDLGPELSQKIYDVGLHRIMSVKAAGTFNKDSDFGTEQDALDYAAMFSTVDGWAKAFEKARREGGAVKVDSVESATIRDLAFVLKRKVEKEEIATAKVAVPRADDPPKTEKGAINFNAWAKVLRDEQHPWYGAIKKQVEARSDSLK